MPRFYISYSGGVFIEAESEQLALGKFEEMTNDQLADGLEDSSITELAE